MAAVQSSRPTTVDELVETLAHKFRVSRDAMSYRLINLGILSQPGAVLPCESTSIRRPGAKNLSLWVEI